MRAQRLSPCFVALMTEECVATVEFAVAARRITSELRCTVAQLMPLKVTFGGILTATVRPDTDSRRRARRHIWTRLGVAVLIRRGESEPVARDCSR